MSEMSVGTEEMAVEAATPEKKQFQFPSSLTILAGITVLVWIIAFFIPPGSYQLNADGEPIPGSFHSIPTPQGLRERVVDLFLVPINGLYGLEDASGHVGPFNAGALYGAVGVFLFLLSIGAFMTMIEATGALDVAIGQLARRLSDRGWALIVAIMIVFSVLGTTMGFSVETLGFYPLLVPLMLALGYDRMAATGMIIFGALVGFMASTVNPFSIGVASGIANVSIGDGLGLRLLLWVVLTGVATAYVVWYGQRVRAKPDRSLVGFDAAEMEAVERERQAAGTVLSGRQVCVLAIMALTFLLLIFAVIPWAGIIGSRHQVIDPISGQAIQPDFWFELGWWFPELTALFLVAAIVVGVVGGLGEQRISSLIQKGAGDFIGPAALVVLAQGITVILTNTRTIDTILHAMENLVHGTSAGLSTLVIYLVSLLLGLIVPSASGNASLVMPLFAPLGDLAGISRSLVITTWCLGWGLIGLIAPTSAVVMGGIALGKVGYDKFLRFAAPMLGIMLVLTAAILVVAARIG